MRWVTPILLLALAACAHNAAYSPTELQSWNAAKAALGPTFAGSPAWQAHMGFVESALAEAGVVDIDKLPAPNTRWWAPEYPTAAERAASIDGRSLPVASYWAYPAARRRPA